MKALLLIFSILFSIQTLLAETQAEKDERLRRRNRAKHFEKNNYTAVGSEDCDDATKVTVTIQKLVHEAKYGAEKDAVSLSDLERKYQAKKSEHVLYNGLNNLNMKYKGFLSSIAGVNGWKPLEGMTEEGFSLAKLKTDLNKAKKHMENVETMAFMDQLLKESIEDHENLTDETATKSKIEEGDFSQSQRELGMPLIHNRTSGSKTFDQLENHCAQPQTNKLLCKILAESTPEGKNKIKATVTGFVDAYRMSKRGDLAKALTSNIMRDDLDKYRKQLLLGIEDATAEKLKVEIKDYKDNNKELKKLSEADPSKLKGMISDINTYQTCLAAEVINKKEGSKKCELAQAASKEYVKKLNNLAQVQHDVVQKLGGNNATIALRMDKIHSHIKVKDNLEQVQKLYGQQPEFKKLIEEKIAAEKISITDDVGSVLKSVLSQSAKSDLALQLKGGPTDDSFNKFIKGNATIKMKSSKELLASVNQELNEKMSEVRCSHNPEKASLEDTDQTTADQCQDAKNGMHLFSIKGDKLDINPSQLEEYLKELNQGKLAENTKRKLDNLTQEMAALKANIDTIRGSKKYDTLNRLLAHYSNKAKVSCQGHSGKELIKCDVNDSDNDSNEKVSALVTSTGKILSSMPSSPGSMAIAELNKSCNTEFMNGFSKEEEKIVNPICNAILQENERYVEGLKPTQKEIKNRREFTYWDGTKRVSEVRQRDRWMVTQAIAGSAIDFLPSYLGHQIQKTSVNSWETSTIEGIKYRNGMLQNYYTYGIYGQGGYYGGSPDYLSNWGGSVYNNGFQTVGTGGFFEFTQPAV